MKNMNPYGVNRVTIPEVREIIGQSTNGRKYLGNQETISWEEDRVWNPFSNKVIEDRLRVSITDAFGMREEFYLRNRA